MKYSIINIGPIVSTISAVRKPRELWSASYIFSFMMKCIIQEVTKYPDGFEIISPAVDEYAGEKPSTRVGVYPDRLFIRHINTDGVKLMDVIAEAKKYIAKELKLEFQVVDDYFNIMLVTEEYSSDTEAIPGLNHKADALELFNRISKTESSEEIIKLVKNKNESPLFSAAGYPNGKFPIETLAHIAAKELMTDKDCINDDDDEKKFYLNNRDRLKSYHKYICVVQADGDNMGKIFSDSALKDGDVKCVSEALLTFGYSASRKIEEFGGLPIYAGGDDLLFIAPVRGCKGKNIFTLIDEIDDCFRKVSDKVKSLGVDQIVPSMSYGVSITYHKFPLYETYGIARRLLFDEAKNEKKHPKKNSIEWELSKHSGSSFKGGICKYDGYYGEFRKLITLNQDETLVSSVSHKIRENGKLIELWADNEADRDSRTDAFFEKIIDMSSGGEYKKCVKTLLKTLYGNVKTDNLTQTMYGMIRTAKFINGEEIRK